MLEELADALDPTILTIGFARRFATYKRAALLFSDEERLARILLNEERPVQIVFAGKAHPADRPGQRVIQDIFARSRSPKFAKRVFVIEDYDIRVGRYLVQGVDVWLNNPRRPLEASGTSGMKAAMNGIINCPSSTAGGTRATTARTAGRSAAARRTPTRAPRTGPTRRTCTGCSKTRSSRLLRARQEGPAAALAADDAQLDASTIWQFSTSRMLQEYVEQLYLPAAEAGAERATARPRSRSRASTAA